MNGSIRLRAEGAGWIAGWQLSRALPERTVRRAFEAMSARSYRRNRARREMVKTNLEPVVSADRLERTVEEAFQWYGRYWAETFRMPDIPDREFARRFRIAGDEHIQAAVDAGRGAILATLHQGNWDAGGRWAGARWGLTAVAEVLRPRALFDRFVAHRESLGIDIIPLERGADVTGRCREELERGRLVALVADRDLGGRGIGVTMFGRRTTMPPGSAVLARQTGAPLIPATVYQRIDGSWDALVLPPLEPADVEPMTQRLADSFATLIGNEPAQWHMFSRYWVG